MKKILLGLILSINFLQADSIYATFSVFPLKSANLAFTSSGLVHRVNVSIGSSVHKGELLAQLDNADVRAMLDVSKTTLKFAKKDYERRLKIRDLIDEAKFDDVTYKYENAKNQLAYQQALYAKTLLKAPFDGVIYAKDIEVGDAVSGLMLKTVFQIQSKSKRKLILSFDQKNRNLIKVGDIFTFSIDGDTKTYSAPITKIYPRANAKDRKLKAEVLVKNFMPGLFGDGYIQTSGNK